MLLFMKKIIMFSTFSILVLSLFNPIFTNAIEKQLSSHVEKSVFDKGITFTVNQYEITEDKFKIHYTVSSNDATLKEKKIGYQYMDRPHFYINNKYLNVAYHENQKRISNKKFTGTISVDLNEMNNSHDNFNFTIVSDKIMDTVGKWKVSFDVK